MLKQGLNSSVFVILNEDVAKKILPDSTIQLNDGRFIPRLGLGVSGLIEGEQTENSIHWALDAGYRHIDTAKLYGNESSVGRAVQEHNMDREEAWVTTKLWPTDFTNPRKAIEGSLSRLNLKFVDLYLIHWPTPIEIPGLDKKLWRSLEAFRDEGLCKSIGVSNFQSKRLAKLLGFANIPPVVNQVKCSPFHFPKELYSFCQTNSIFLVGYNPLNQGKELENSLLLKIADIHKKTAAQIMLRWAVQKDVIPIPKSKSEDRIHENINIFDFELTQTEIEELDSLSGIK